MLVDYLNRQRAEGRCMRHELLGYVCNEIVIRARSFISEPGCGCKRAWTRMSTILRFCSKNAKFDSRFRMKVFDA